MRVSEFITEGRSHPVICVDVQPEYNGGPWPPANPKFVQIMNFVQKQTGPGISEIGIIVADAGRPLSGQKKEVGFFFVKLDKALRGQGAIDYYQAQLKIAKGLAQ